MSKVVLVLFISHLAVAQTRSVCEALQDLPDLNGKKVKVRGVWHRGDTGQSLWSQTICKTPLVRDGWIWRDIIEVSPEYGNASVAGFAEKYLKMSRANPDAWVLVTLVGRLETCDHFEVRTLPGNGLVVPKARYVALLRMESAEDFEAAPLKPGEREQAIEISKRLWPERAK